MSWCWLFGHAYFVDRDLSPVCRVVHCDKCPKQWVMNDTYRGFARLDDDAKKMIDVVYGVKL